MYCGAIVIILDIVILRSLIGKWSAFSSYLSASLSLSLSLSVNTEGDEDPNLSLFLCSIAQ